MLIFPYLGGFLNYMVLLSFRKEMLKMQLKLLKNMNQKWGKCIDKIERAFRESKQGTLCQVISWKWQVRLTDVVHIVCVVKVLWGPCLNDLRPWGDFAEKPKYMLHFGTTLLLFICNYLKCAFALRGLFFKLPLSLISRSKSKAS